MRHVDIMTKKLEINKIIDASKEVGLEVNTEKTKYMLLSRRKLHKKQHSIFL
jgi:hypothetical protein